MKILIVILVLLICIIISVKYIKQIRNHTKAIKQCILLIENIKILIEYKNLAINEIFEIVCSTDNYSLLSFLNSLNREVNEYQKVLDNIFSENCSSVTFDLEDRENLKGFFSMLGKSDTNGQIMNCELYKKMFEKKFFQLEKDEKSRCKSGVVLILGIGLVFSIIII